MQTHPWAPEFSRQAFQLASYGVLATVSSCCPPLKGRFSTHYSPVRHCLLTEVSFSFDLHVWSTPPAFVLSQDQTLHCQKVISAIQLRIVSSSLFALLSLRVFCCPLSFFWINKVFIRFQLFCCQSANLFSTASWEALQCRHNHIGLGFTYIIYQMHYLFASVIRIYYSNMSIFFVKRFILKSLIFLNSVLIFRMFSVHWARLLLYAKENFKSSTCFHVFKAF